MGANMEHPQQPGEARNRIRKNPSCRPRFIKIMYTIMFEKRKRETREKEYRRSRVTCATGDVRPGLSLRGQRWLGPR